MTSQLFAGIVYYVDATNGNDQNNGLSEATAWKTINKVNNSSFLPGDTILFKRGEIWYEMLDVNWSGTDGSPITFGVYGTGNRPIISGATKSNPTGPSRSWAARTYHQHHLNFENLEFQYATRDGLRTNGEGFDQSTHCYDITITNCVSHHNQSHGFKASQDGNTDTVTTYLVTYTDCQAYNNGWHGFQASDGSGQISYINCISHDNGNCGFRFGETQTGLMQNCESYNNSYGVRIAAWNVEASAPENITIEYCDIYKNGGSGDSCGIWIGTSGSWAVDGLLFRYNRIYENTGEGIVCYQPSNGSEVYYNLIWNNSDGGIIWQPYVSGGDSEIYNNVLHANNSGIEVGFNVTAVIKNNILYYNNTQVFAAGGTWDYNCYYPNISFSRKGQHDISADPLFLDATNPDYHLQSNSPCINAGTDVGLTQDYERNTVPYGNGVDIGAYEYTGASPLDAEINASPTSGWIPLAINFTGSATGGTEPYTYAWDFGDGYSSTEQNPSHTYSNAGDFTVTLTVTDSQSNQNSDSLTINATLGPTPPYLSCSPTIFYFGASTSGNETADQYLRIINAGSGILTWNIEDNADWLSCSPSSGTDRGEVTVSVNASELPIGPYTATITVSSPEAYNSPQYLAANLRVYESNEDNPPFGSLDTPVDGSTVSGSIPITGWALDDIEVIRLEIKRNSDPVDLPEAIGLDGLVYIGDAVFVEGARPDVEKSYPDYPLNSRAGWGYMLLTNDLPYRGNGSFTIYTFAYDAGGHREEIGKKTILCDNINRVKPFGTIDTREQEENIRGSDYINFGWALTPLPKTIPKDGSTIWVWVDGVQVGHPVYDQYREDIAMLYPEYNNAQGAVGYYYIDTTQFENGVHTIAWSVMDDGGEVAGIGARYFFIDNIETGSAYHGSFGLRSIYRENAEGRLRIGIKEVRRGYRLQVGNEAEIYKKGILKIQPEEMETRSRYRLRTDDGRDINIEDILKIQIEEMEPIRIVFEENSEGNMKYIGWGENKAQDLPVGSTLDREKGIFSWIPTPGFIGRYVLHFAVTDDLSMSRPLRVEVNVIPKEIEIKKIERLPPLGLKTILVVLHHVLL